MAPNPLFSLTGFGAPVFVLGDGCFDGCANSNYAYSVAAAEMQTILIDLGISTRALPLEHELAPSGQSLPGFYPPDILQSFQSPTPWSYEWNLSQPDAPAVNQGGDYPHTPVGNGDSYDDGTNGSDNDYSYSGGGDPGVDAEQNSPDYVPDPIDDDLGGVDGEGVGTVSDGNGGTLPDEDHNGHADNNNDNQPAGSVGPDYTGAATGTHDPSDNDAYYYPVILDLDGDGIEVSAGKPVQFDMDDDGFYEATSWASADDGFLVIDLNADGTRGVGDGVIDQTNELVLSNWGEENSTDLQALQYAFDDDGNGALDANEGIWDELRVWQDLNQNGVTDEGELHSLSDLGITSISVEYDNGEDFPDPNQNADSPNRALPVFGITLFGVASMVRNGETIAGAVGDVSLNADELGWRLVETGFGFEVEFETGEFLRYASLKPTHDADVDLNHKFYTGAVGDDRANVLTAEGASWRVEIDGGDGDDSVVGGGNDDVLVGGNGADTLVGWAGNDLLIVDADDFAAGHVTGGRGYDTAMLLGSVAIDVALSDHAIEAFLGGTGADTLSAGTLEEGVELYGGDGDDSITGGDGDDVLNGDSHDDVVNGGNGDDYILGGRGQDTLRGQSVDDRVFGGNGEDRIAGLNGDDYLSGGGADDRILGQSGDDVLSGDAGDDYLTGGMDDDTVNGGSGNDTIGFGDGDDSLDGGNGDDTFVLAPTDANEDPRTGRGKTTIQGGDGTDTLILDVVDIDELWRVNDTYWQVILLDADGETVAYIDVTDVEKILTVGQANDGSYVEYTLQDGSFSASHNVFSIDLDGISEIESALQTLNFFDTIGQDWGDGADLINGDIGEDDLFGGAGSDTIDGGSGADVINGYTSSDELIGSSGSDSLIGDNGDDTLFGEAGNDTLWGGNNEDSLNGGSGADALVGGKGLDTLDGGSGNDSLWGGQDSDLLLGGSGFDYLSGDVGADTLHGGSGVDRLEGGDGNDDLFGEFGSDRLFGGDGDDFIRGGDGFDYLSGGDGNDDLNGQLHDDHLDGGAGNDTLNGGFGNDLLEGGDGADLIDGGDGLLDTVVYTSSDAGVEIGLATGVATGGHANGDVLANVENVVGSSFQDTLSGDALNNILDGGDGDDILISSGGRDIVIGGNGNDDMDGGASWDRLWGGAGNDTIEGGDGKDLVDGGDGNDNLRGGDGDDTIIGGEGDDMLRGNAGGDLFVFTDGAGHDTIAGFNTSEDLEIIDLSGLSEIESYADLVNNHMTQVGSDVRIEIDSETSIQISGVALADMTEDHFAV